MKITLKKKFTTLIKIWSIYKFALFLYLLYILLYNYLSLTSLNLFFYRNHFWKLLGCQHYNISKSLRSKTDEILQRKIHKFSFTTNISVEKFLKGLIINYQKFKHMLATKYKYKAFYEYKAYMYVYNYIYIFEISSGIKFLQTHFFRQKLHMIFNFTFYFMAILWRPMTEQCQLGDLGGLIILKTFRVKKRNSFCTWFYPVLNLVEITQIKDILIHHSFGVMVQP